MIELVTEETQVTQNIDPVATGAHMAWNRSGHDHLLPPCPTSHDLSGEAAPLPGTLLTNPKAELPPW